jgi:hypothetical protein
MFTALTLSLALGAPIPPQGPPVASGPAPQVVELKPDDKGKVLVTVLRTEKVQVGAVARPAAPGAPAGAPANAEITVARFTTVELSDVKDLTVTTADGKKVDKEEALKKLARGGVVVVSSDGKAVSPVFLKVFKDDTLVLASPELKGSTAAVPGLAPGRPVPAVPGGVQILPAVPGNVQVLPVQGGVIQLKVAPAAILPAAPVQPPPAPGKK